MEVRDHENACERACILIPLAEKAASAGILEANAKRDVEYYTAHIYNVVCLQLKLNEQTLFKLMYLLKKLQIGILRLFISTSSHRK